MVFLVGWSRDAESIILNQSKELLNNCRRHNVAFMVLIWTALDPRRYEHEEPRPRGPGPRVVSRHLFYMVPSGPSGLLDSISPLVLPLFVAGAQPLIETQEREHVALSLSASCDLQDPSHFHRL